MIGNMIGKSTICNSISKPVEFDRFKTIFVMPRKRSEEVQVATTPNGLQFPPVLPLNASPDLSIRIVTFDGHSAKQWFTEDPHEKLFWLLFSSRIRAPDTLVVRPPRPSNLLFRESPWAFVNQMEPL
jgi:hypothetical protein